MAKFQIKKQPGIKRDAKETRIEKLFFIDSSSIKAYATTKKCCLAWTKTWKKQALFDIFGSISLLFYARFTNLLSNLPPGRRGPGYVAAFWAMLSKSSIYRSSGSSLLEAENFYRVNDVKFCGVQFWGSVFFYGIRKTQSPQNCHATR